MAGLVRTAERGVEVSAEILSFERGQKLLRPAGTWTAALWRRTRQRIPANEHAMPDPPEPRYA